MQPQTISEVSKAHGISARMLRYYEKAGLLQSTRQEGYAYRMYDEANQRRLAQILVLRRLRLTTRQIATVLESPGGAAAVEVFRQSLAGVEREITALATIRGILAGFVRQLESTTGQALPARLLEEESLALLLAGIAPADTTLKEENSMQALNLAAEALARIEVRVLYVPPMAVVASHHFGEEPETQAHAGLTAFIRESGLLQRKPDTRVFGFNAPATLPGTEAGPRGYEMWASIPEDLMVPAPLEKKRFAGGLYAAHAIQFGQFDHWGLLYQWVMDNPQYEPDWESRVTPPGEGNDPAMEERLNFHAQILDPALNEADTQLDLLMPIRERGAS